MRFYDDTNGIRWVDSGMGWVPALGIPKDDVPSDGGGSDGGGGLCYEVKEIYTSVSAKQVAKTRLTYYQWIRRFNRAHLIHDLGPGSGYHSRGIWLYAPGGAGLLRGTFSSAIDKIGEANVADCLLNIVRETTQPTCASGYYPDSGILRESCGAPQHLQQQPDGAPCFRCVPPDPGPFVPPPPHYTPAASSAMFTAGPMLGGDGRWYAPDGLGAGRKAEAGRWLARSLGKLTE